MIMALREIEWVTIFNILQKRVPIIYYRVISTIGRYLSVLSYAASIQIPRRIAVKTQQYSIEMAR